MCCRSVLAGLAVGLDEIVFLVINDPTVSHTYINGFKLLCSHHKIYFVVAGISAYASEAILTSLATDDRFIKNHTHLYVKS